MPRSLEPGSPDHFENSSLVLESPRDEVSPATMAAPSAPGRTWRPVRSKWGSPEEHEFGFQGEKAMRRLKHAAACFTFVGVIIACGVAAFRHGWSSAVTAAERRSYQWNPRTQIHERGHLLYIGIFSAPANFDKRQVARHRWTRELQLMYPNGSVKVEFLIGQVPIQGNNPQSGVSTATAEEVLIESQLQEESEANGDIRRMPIVESTTLQIQKDSAFETDKILWLLSRAVSWGAQFVMKVTDDQRVIVDEALNEVLDRPANVLVYFGKEWIHDVTPEADGRESGFFDGKCYGMSGVLAHRISVNHFNHSIAFPTYGTNSDDVNVAKWIKFEKKFLPMESDFLKLDVVRLHNLCHGLTPDPTTRAATTTTPFDPCRPESPCGLRRARKL